MKKFIAALVGGIIIFAWQTLSWVVLNLHYGANQYTAKQDTVLNFLGTQLSEEGQYLLPSLPKDATTEQHEQFMKTQDGKPWALVSYHKAWNANMVMNMVRGLIVNILMVGLLCWLLMKIPNASFGTIFLGSVFGGLIAFLNTVYTRHIWYPTFDLMANLTDALVSWGACGLWLGWYLSRRR